MSPVTPGGVSRRILVADDDPDGAETLAVMLRSNGHEVRVAGDGPAALEVANDFRPQVIFLDLGMPGMDGYQIARGLRQMDGLDIAARSLDRLRPGIGSSAGVRRWVRRVPRQARVSQGLV